MSASPLFNVVACQIRTGQRRTSCRRAGLAYGSHLSRHNVQDLLKALTKFGSVVKDRVYLSHCQPVQRHLAGINYVFGFASNAYQVDRPHLYLNKQSSDAKFMPSSKLSGIAGYSMIAVGYKVLLNILE